MNIRLSEVQNLLVLTTRVAIKSHLEEIETAKKRVGEAWRDVLKAIGSELGVDLPLDTQIVEVEDMRYELQLPGDNNTGATEETDCVESEEPVLSEV